MGNKIKMYPEDDGSYKLKIVHRQMTNSEINEAVARELGLLTVTRWRENGGDKVGVPRPRDTENYCTDISAAWEVVLSVKGRIELHRRYDKWKCWLRDEIEAGEADTAPMAICMAFLKVEGRCVR